MARVIFELIKGGTPVPVPHRRGHGPCHVGHRRSGRGEVSPGHPSAPTTAIRGTGTHKIIFSNVDDELRLWVDASVVPFSEPTTYDSVAIQARVPMEADLSPAGIATRKAAAKVSHVKLRRDIYYIADKESRKSYLTDFITAIPHLADPRTWKTGFWRGET